MFLYVHHLPPHVITTYILLKSPRTLSSKSNLCPYVSMTCNSKLFTIHIHMTEYRLYGGPDLKLFILVGLAGASCLLPTEVQLVLFLFFFCFRFSVMLSDFPGISNRRAAYCICESSFLIQYGVYYNVFVCH